MRTPWSMELKYLMDSAEVMEEFEGEEHEPTGLEKWILSRWGSKGLWNFMVYTSVVLALAFTIGIFIILPTGIVAVIKLFTTSAFWLNFAEGLVRIALFIAYVWAVSHMKEIQRVFMFHGAEHKTIHTFENLPRMQETSEPDLKLLTLTEVRNYPTLHPRCGTSFLMFVFIIAFFCHFLLGWPELWLRIVTVLLLPVIAENFHMNSLSGREEVTILWLKC